MKYHRARWTVLLPCLLLLSHCRSQDTFFSAPALQVVEAFPGLQFEEPLFLTFAPGDTQRLFVVEKRGIIRVFENDPGVTSSKVFLDLVDRINEALPEEGLLGLAFDPNYQANGFLYVNFNPRARGAASPRRTEIARFGVSEDPDAANRLSLFTILAYDQSLATNKGGWMGFGPDGKLYIASGDGGGNGDPNNNAQNLGSLLGKILRIDKDGRIPSDNPFARFSSTDGRGAIWAYGLHNPRPSFDRQTGELWTGDPGQAAREEVDVIVKGGNYGWRKFEGTQVFNADDPDPGNAIPPLFEYAHDNERCKIVGGYVYRGAELGAYAGTYFFADRCTGEVFIFRRRQATVVAEVPGSPTAFGEDAAGELYITTAEGKIYKLALL